MDKLSTEKLLKLKEAALGAANCGIVISDLSRDDNPLIYVNDTFCNMTGYSAEETVGKNCRFLQGNDRDQAGLDIVRDAIKNKTEAQVILKNYRKDGSLFYNELFISPVKDDNGEVTHFIGVQSDVTRRVLAEQSLLIKANDLEKSNKELEQYAFAVSHDLQEPLRMVSTFLDILSSKYHDSFDEKAKEYITYALDGSHRMQELINDLLEFSRNSYEEDNSEEFLFSEIIDAVTSNLKNKIEESKAVLNLKFDLKLQGIKSQFVSLMQNLISNSIKYCKNPSPIIDINCEEHDTVALFSIKDNGIGIDMHYAEYIFEVFNRLHSKRDFPGTGIGLAICKKIVQNHQGNIWLEKSSKLGSEFRFTVPKARIIKSKLLY